MIYIDTDVLFFDAVENLWNNFYKMDSNQMIGIVEEAPHSYFYEEYKRLQPLIGKYGANSGVLLMNLTRIREFGWVSKIVQIHEEYTKDLRQYYFYQGLINITLTSYPGDIKNYLLVKRQQKTDLENQYLGT